MKKWIWLALFSCGVAHADMLEALQAYETKNFNVAERQFEELLPLGNELAAFNLGVMAYQGEGQQADLTKALGYFMLAAELQHEQAEDILEKLSAKATQQQLEEAKTNFDLLKSQVVITARKLEQVEEAERPTPIERKLPKYPKEAERAGQFGYVVLRFLVDEQGEVGAIDILDSFPEKVFDKSAVKALKRWRYEPGHEKKEVRLRLDYSLSGAIYLSQVEKFMVDNNVWEYAAAGAQNYQFALGTLLNMLEIQSRNYLSFNPDLPLAAAPDFDIYKKFSKVKFDVEGFEGFEGSVIVRVAADGTITEQIEDNISDRSEMRNVIGKKLNGDIENDIYRLYKTSLDDNTPVRVMPVVETSRSMSAMFWWKQAAKNGDLAAQRVLAARITQWEDYLLAQEDPQVMAWKGTRLLLDGQHDQGMSLLDQAIAKNYGPAKEMKKMFM